jgi:hypothetical protein
MATATEMAHRRRFIATIAFPVIEESKKNKTVENDRQGARVSRRYCYSVAITVRTTH